MTGSTNPAAKIAPTLLVTTRTGEVRAVSGLLGHSVMESIRDAQIDEILATCGGMCACATCHVLVDPEQLKMLPSMSEDEDALLDGLSLRSHTSRLSCQLRVTHELDGLRLTVAPEE